MRPAGPPIEQITRRAANLIMFYQLHGNSLADVQRAS